jgi:hypothetical protein
LATHFFMGSWKREEGQDWFKTAGEQSADDRMDAG